MDQSVKLSLALMQIENISNLIEGNQWEGFFASHLLPMKYELERQISLLTPTTPLPYNTGEVSNQE